MSLVEKICEELGVEVNEAWYGSDGKNYIINQVGNIWEMYNPNLTAQQETQSIWKRVIGGDLKPMYRPRFDDLYYYPSFGASNLAECHYWQNDDIDEFLLAHKMVFKTEEEAREYTNRILALIKEE